ncbi:unnamed protein product [Jaminaea pallidilutea]
MYKQPRSAEGITRFEASDRITRESKPVLPTAEEVALALDRQEAYTRRMAAGESLASILRDEERFEENRRRLDTLAADDATSVRRRAEPWHNNSVYERQV